MLVHADPLYVAIPNEEFSDLKLEYVHRDGFLMVK